MFSSLIAVFRPAPPTLPLFNEKDRELPPFSPLRRPHRNLGPDHSHGLPFAASSSSRPYSPSSSTSEKWPSSSPPPAYSNFAAPLATPSPTSSAFPSPAFPQPATFAPAPTTAAPAPYRTFPHDWQTSVGPPDAVLRQTTSQDRSGENQGRRW